MSYELQVHALSPLRPTPREILLRAGESGLALEMTPAPGTGSSPDDRGWTKLLLRSAEAERGGFLVEVASDADRSRVHAAFREDSDAGESVPDEVLAAPVLYVLELDDESPGGEDHQAAFVIAAWALASLTEAIVFDPEEEFFADADSFWGLLTDETSGDEGCGAVDEEEDDDGGGGEADHGRSLRVVPLVGLGDSDDDQETKQ